MRSLDFDRIDHVYIRPGYTDLRKGIDGLSIVQKNTIHPARKRAYIV